MKPESERPARHRRRAWGPFSLGLLVGAGAVAAFSFLNAAAAAHHGFGQGAGGWGLHGPAPAGAHLREPERVAEVMATLVDATPEQRERLVGVVRDTSRELLDLRGVLAAQRREIHRILGAPEVDADALEAVRAAHLEAADDASRRLVDAVVEIAEILTPEQRLRLVELHEAIGRR